ncbi:LOW QUALITY PROTEIN: hypothetical protein HJFPF1_11623 [Paramyrothecium foliicola]|nr:LOW QUALITY PROTEIN: hypothetical protein HJFPF1_11623 [Paramyrothecium foliicola]
MRWHCPHAPETLFALPLQPEPRCLEARTKSKSHDHGSSRRSSLSFLFVVNELIVDYDYSDGVASRDDWLNAVPPSTYLGYNFEIQSRVMRYRDGNVAEAHGYQFGRGETALGMPKAPGVVWAFLSDGSIIQAEHYSSYTVFSCNPLLPVIVAEGDASTYSDIIYHPLQFFHPIDASLKGVSQVAWEDSPMSEGGAPVKYVAGQNPTWMPGLVPESYRNPYRHSPPPSVGLAGELPVVIGLMAFSEAYDRQTNSNCVDEIFLGQDITGGGGIEDGRTVIVPPDTAQEDPRGFMVAVYLDPENPEGSTAGAIRAFEWEDVIVAG